MLFNSLSFFLFFPIVTIIYYLLPHRFRWILLLVASCIFYMSFIPGYILILAYLIVIDYFAGIWLQKTKGRKRKYLLFLSIISNIGTLFFFKYFNFMQDNIAAFGHLIHWNYSTLILHLVLPIGLSFHVFQSLSYIIEVYKKRYKAEKHFGRYALYVLFFPQLVAGPIERPKDLLPQFSLHHKFDQVTVIEGLRRIIFGLFKKMVIADRLAIVVNQVYGNPHDYIGFPLILATIAFAIQVYCDFSGYSDIAIGSAKVLGFTLRENFNYPYLSKSIPEFWRRWHMSLYSWFRDYIYIGLGGNRHGNLLQARNILIVFFVTGLWHGASWNFVIWGMIHGIYMVIALLIAKYIKPVFAIFSFRKPLSYVLNGASVVFTFLLTCFAWIFFRANTLSDALYIVTHLTTGIKGLGDLLLQRKFYDFAFLAFDQHKGIGLPLSQLVIAACVIVFMIFLESLHNKNIFIFLPRWARWTVYIVLVLSILNLGPASQEPFIYFQF